MKVKSFVLILFSICILSSCGTPVPTGTISPTDFKRAIAQHKNLQLIDVRTSGEFKAGYIKGAINIDYFGEDFQMEIKKLDKSKPIAVYCGVGGRSGSTLKVLQDLGFKKIYDLDGGISLWKDKNQELVKN